VTSAATLSVRVAPGAGASSAAETSQKAVHVRPGHEKRRREKKMQNPFFMAGHRIYFRIPKSTIQQEHRFMPKFSIAFISPETEKPLKHRIIESDDQESALKKFFEEETVAYYSNDEQGYHYFKEDFFDPSNGMGNIIVCD
jgi:hypothetical protein